MNAQPGYQRLATLGLAIAAALAAGRPAFAQNLVSNGSFEAGMFENHFGGFMILSPDSTKISGWTVINDLLTWSSTPNAKAILAADGNFFLDLQGPGLFDPPYGGVTQLIDTEVGESYFFSFFLGVEDGKNRGPIEVSAGAGAKRRSFTYHETGAGTHWMSFGLYFTATSSTTPITILGTMTTGGAYIGLDDVLVYLLPAPLADADFNSDLVVDGADFLLWQRNLGKVEGSADRSHGDANEDGNLNAADLMIWRNQFGIQWPPPAMRSVPEAASLTLAVIGGFLLVAVRQPAFTEPPLVSADRGAQLAASKREFRFSPEARHAQQSPN